MIIQEEKANPFKVTMPILKTVKTDDGKVVIQGLGGDDLPDSENERCSRACIEDMYKQIRTATIPLVKVHWDRQGKVLRRSPDWTDVMGTIVDAIVTPYGQLFPEIELDMTSSASRDLVRKLEAGKQLGLSWGGYVAEFHIETTIDGRTRKVFDKIILWHFAVTSRPANSRTLNHPLQTIAKSIENELWSSADTLKVEQLESVLDFPEFDEVKAIYKSLDSDAANAVPEKEDARMALTAEEINLISSTAATAVTKSLEGPLSKLTETLNGVNTGLLSVTKSIEDSSSNTAKVVEEAVKAATPEPKTGDDDGDGGSEETKTTSSEEIADMVKEAVKAALPELKTAIKSGMDNTGAPASGDSEDEVVKAFKDIKDGKKTIDDLPLSIQREIEDHAAKGMKGMLEKMSQS